MTPVVLAAAVLVASVATVAGATVVHLAALKRLRARAQGIVTWRNLDVSGYRRTPAPRAVPSWIVALIGILGLGGSLSALVSDAPAWSMVLSIAAAVSVGAFAVSGALEWRRFPRWPQVEELNRSVRAAFANLDATDVYYLAAAFGDSLAESQWRNGLDGSSRSVALLRHADLLRFLHESTRPILVEPDARLVELVIPTKATRILCASDSNLNNHVLRIPGMHQVFLGAERNPALRAYDEVQLRSADEVTRLLQLKEGFRAEQLTVGPDAPDLDAVPREPETVGTHSPQLQSRGLGLPSIADFDAVLRAFRSHDPSVLVHFSGPPSSTHALDAWLPTLRRIRHRVAVVVRDDWHLNAALGGLPAVHLPAAADVAEFAGHGATVALYPTNVATNNDLIRVPGLMDVFIGHGDSDKAGSANPLSRIYDEVWIAGEVAQERYERANVGVRPEQIRRIGRPQLPSAPPARERGGAVTVLYAPTWEGFYDSWSYSSLLVLGEAIVTRLVEDPRVRVVYRPHPATGSVDARFITTDRNIRSILNGAGAAHRVSEGIDDLHPSFDGADILIADVSSVVTDYLAWDRPIFMCNPSGIDEREFIQANPSAAAATRILHNADALVPAIVDAVEHDEHRQNREPLRNRLLGDTGDRALAQLEAAIDAADTEQRRRIHYRGSVPGGTTPHTQGDEAQ